MTFSDGYWWSNDGLRLHYRDYPGDDAVPPLLCLPGLTRNARDFEPLAASLNGRCRMICVDFRGRGESAYARDPMTYVPLIYTQDVERLIDTLSLPRLALLGTSLGGIVAMMLAAAERSRVAGVALNDVGPALEAEGLARIRGNIGRGGGWPTWVHAARWLQDINGALYPDYDLGQWLAFTKRVCRLTPGGRIVLDYDKTIAEPLRLPGGEAGIDLWPAFDSMAGLPTLILRGALSDVLSDSGLRAMTVRIDGVDAVTIPRVGHAPALDEPEAVAAIGHWLERVAA